MTSVLGNRVLRSEDPRFLTGGGDYVGNRRWPDELHAVYVRSPVAHAHIAAIDTHEAAGHPEVATVVTAADLPGIGPLPLEHGEFDDACRRPLLATDRVRFVGELVAVVVAETLEAATDAAEAVVVSYEALPAAVTLDAAEAADVVLFDDLGTNVVATINADDPAFDVSGCEVVIERRWFNQRLAPVPIEASVSAARWDDGRLTHYAASQGAGAFRDALIDVFGYHPDAVRVITPDVGGGFGARGAAHPEELLVAELARRLGRPVRWSETRSENLQAMVHGRAVDQHVTLGGTRDGRITHWRSHWRQDAGAYPAIGALLPVFGHRMGPGVYDIAHVSFTSVSYATNTNPVGAYRGAGRPEATAALERAIDVYAATIGVDPAEVRRRNLMAPFDAPTTTAVGTVYDTGDYPGALDRALTAAGYNELRARQQRRRAEGHPVQLGIGLACYVEITGIGPPEGSAEFATVELVPGGGLVVRTGATPFGQGHATTWAMVAADHTGVPAAAITVVHGDTDQIPSSSVTGGSRSVQIAGSSVVDAAGRLVDAARSVAAEALEARVDDIVLDADAGRFHVAGTPAVAIDWADVAAAVGASTSLVGTAEFVQERATYPFGAHVAVVEVDTDTGLVRLVRHVAVDDCGTIINPLIAEGQVHGGLAQGAAQALFEEVCYDSHGTLLTGTLADYAVPSAADLPSFERVEMVTPTPLNPLGAKGIGESGTIGATPAVHNAVVDALAPFGVDHLDMPCSPMRVWEALGRSR